jgi:hypothetical protein
MIYNLDSYPPSDSFLDTVENDVPESLKLLLETITKKKHKNSEEKFTDNTKVTSVAHCLIVAARPRFFSPHYKLALDHSFIDSSVQNIFSSYLTKKLMVLESRGSRDTKTVNLETLKHFRTHI